MEGQRPTRKQGQGLLYYMQVVDKEWHALNERYGLYWLIQARLLLSLARPYLALLCCFTRPKERGGVRVHQRKRERRRRREEGEEEEGKEEGDIRC